MGLLGHNTTLLSLVELAVVAGLAMLLPLRRVGPAGPAGLVVLVVAGSPAVHGWSERTFAGHMVQHLALIAVAAPLLAVAVTGRRVLRRQAAPVLRRAVVPPLAPVISATAHVVTLVLWHVPFLYDRALENSAVHLAEHATLLGTAVWWWAAILHHLRRRRPFAPVLTLFAVGTSCAVLGVVLLFAATPWFAYAGDRPDRLDDQRVAGALMAGSGMVGGAVALVLVSRAVASLAEPGRRRIPSSLAVLAPLALGVGVAALTPRTAATAQTADASQTADGAASVETLDLGRDLYQRDCTSCHGPEGGGTFRGVPIDGEGTATVRYAVGTGRMPIADPASPVERGPIRYEPDEIDALVAYTATFITSGPAVPDLDGVEADVVAGGVLYRRHCAACHGATGIGGALAFQRETPSLLEAEPIDVATAVVAGPGAMPALSATFDRTELASVAGYVELLQDPTTTGVNLPGDRVTEGLVAWLVGVGALLVAVALAGRITT